MRTVFSRIGAGLTLGLMLLAVNGPARAGDDRAPAVHKMEIFNGPIKTTHYFSTNTSPGEQASLRDLERSENEMTLADQTLALRLQYVNDERALQARKRQVQELLYGYNSETSNAFGVFGGGSYGGFPYAYPFVSPFGGTGLYAGAYATGSASSSNTLAVGIGDEGPIKTDMAKVIAGQATPEYAALVSRNYDAALARVGESDRLRGGIKAVIGEVPSGGRGPDVVMLKDGSRVEGAIAKEDADWLVMNTGTKDNPREEKVRMSEVVRISRSKKGGENKP
jgi:hypothetical protein